MCAFKTKVIRAYRLLKEKVVNAVAALHLEEVKFFFLFIFHRYSSKQFNPFNTSYNMRLIFRAAGNEWLNADKEGKLTLLVTRAQKNVFIIKNFLCFNALQKRVEKVIFFSCVTVTLELNNPFNRRVLKLFLKKKLGLLDRILNYVQSVNGRSIDLSTIKQHIDVFHRTSLFQDRVIKIMHLAVRRQPKKTVVEEARAALKKGLYPVLVTMGLSGSYWMRGLDRNIIGLFKPFDEELHAPHNPSGPNYRGALGLRRSRMGCRVGENAHHEVAAFVVDAFFGFGIVPHTYYASFTHHMFFSNKENQYKSWRTTKTKYGSFQEYIEGFVPADELDPEEMLSIPIDEFQLLVLLDVIIGNNDRNINNILFGDGKIAAIDHGLCFPDDHEQLSYWYWSFFPQAQRALLPSIIELLDHFPYEKLAHKLKCKCFVTQGALCRMRERVALFTAAIHEGLHIYQIESLFTPVYLDPLRELDRTIKEAAEKQVRLFKQDYPL